MKKITLTGIRDSLRYMQYVIEVEPDVATRARGALDRMMAVGA